MKAHVKKIYNDDSHVSKIKSLREIISTKGV
jgi:hypothetical protein